METGWIYIVICGLLLQTVFIRFEYAKKPLAALILKSLASLTFVLLGILCLPVAKDSCFGWLIAAGLVLGATGDVLLNLRQLVANARDKIFMMGIAAFLIGHLLYVAALITRGVNALLIAVPLCAVLSTVTLWFVLKRVEVAGKLRIFGIVYIVIVLWMMSCAVGLLALTPANTGYLLFAVGAVLFATSDVILIFHLFGRKKHRAFRAMNLSAYYLGQLLIALSLLSI